MALPMPRLAPVTNATPLDSDIYVPPRCFAPGTVTVSVSTPDRSNVPGWAPVSTPRSTMVSPPTITCSMPTASA